MMGEILDAPNKQAVGLPPPWTVDNEGNESAPAEQVVLIRRST